MARKKSKKIESPKVVEEVVVKAPVEEAPVVETPAEETPKVETPVETPTSKTHKEIKQKVKIKKEQSIEEKILKGKKQRLEMEKAWKKRNNISDPQTNLFSYGLTSLL